jgi:hypothetical protein
MFDPSLEIALKSAEWDAQMACFRERVGLQHSLAAQSFALCGEYQDLIAASNRRLASQRTAMRSAQSCMVRPAVRVESAVERRLRQLKDLEQEFPVVFASKWQVCVGSTLIWPYAGRWMNQETGERGKLGSLHMRQFLGRVRASQSVR